MVRVGVAGGQAPVRLAYRRPPRVEVVGVRAPVQLAYRCPPVVVAGVLVMVPVACRRSWHASSDSMYGHVSA